MVSGRNDGHRGEMIRTPYAHAYANLALFFDLERKKVVVVRILRSTSLSWRTGPQLLHMMLRLDINTLALELLHSVLRQLLVEHR